VPPSSRPTIAVALHDIEPATFERCALIRDWLNDHGVARVTLLVIPARDLHPVGQRSPEMTDWLAGCRRAGDSIAQHGFRHERLRRAGWPQRLLTPTRTGRAAEFVGLDDGETRRAVEAGWRLLKLAGIEPDGFVAPAYAYTPALRHVLNARFRWWASLLSLHGTQALGEPTGALAPERPGGRSRLQLPRRGPQELPGAPNRPWRRLAPAWTLSADGPLGRALSPALIRAGAALAGSTLRLDLHPSDLQHPRHMLALEWVLSQRGTRRRAAVTYDELAAGQATMRPDGARRLSIGLAGKP
jgi:predicted deacetylase